MVFEARITSPVIGSHIAQPRDLGGGAGSASRSGPAHRARVRASPGRGDAHAEPRAPAASTSAAGTGRHAMRPRRPVDKAGIALGVEAGNPAMGALARDPHRLRRHARPACPAHGHAARTDGDHETSNERYGETRRPPGCGDGNPHSFGGLPFSVEPSPTSWPGTSRGRQPGSRGCAPQGSGGMRPSAARRRMRASNMSAVSTQSAKPAWRAAIVLLTNGERPVSAITTSA